MALVLRYAARSDVGKVRAKNDDSAYAGQYLAVVADGMGGHVGGDVASASTVLDLVHLDHHKHDDDAGTVLADEIQTANSLLNELVDANPRLAGMGTTVTALLLTGQTLRFAHIGDSRAYRLRDGVFEQMSIDHTFVQRLIDEGRLRPEDAEYHPHKNVLMRVLGDVDASPELDLHEYDTRVGDRWLLCSDGLTAVVPSGVLSDIVRGGGRLQDIVDTLVDLTLEGGAPDNVTVVMIEVAEGDPGDTRTSRLAALPPSALRVTPRGARRGRRDEGEATGAHPVTRPAGGAETEADRSSTPVVTSETGPAGERAAEAVSAGALREELAGHPHVLVGAAALATETGRLPTVAKRSVDRQAAALLRHRDDGDDGGDGTGTPHRRRSRRPLYAVVAVICLLALVAAAGWGYAWTQTRYYVGESDGEVAIYNGVSQTLGPIRLAHVETRTGITVSSLPEYSQERVRMTVPADSTDRAQQIIADLRLPGPDNPLPTPSCSPSPSPGASGSARPSAGASSSPRSSTESRGQPTRSPSPSPSATASSPNGSASASGRPRATTGTPSATPTPSVTPCGGQR
ncbi:phosphoprotein phosphatase [Tersicoccus solisilvae]|uniref:Phosphoprotein phosphatase n=1 Tax=Tersicoccus solisilvae TaxID=1882339 RepID=A0ABQ1NNC5_9MICC|nr:PP2C family serine/threonine-protein phosphatase [Tersicoccus solisilvae]GGC78602.1 phosphoprotein phosphatase [Tersicoccus solisilvae]